MAMVRHNSVVAVTSLVRSAGLDVAAAVGSSTPAAPDGPWLSLMSNASAIRTDRWVLR